MSKQETNTKRSFPRGFKPQVEKLKQTETCTHKRHFRDAFREVIGYVELLAAKDPQRFVWAEVKTIAKACKHFDKDQYNAAQVAKAEGRKPEKVSREQYKLRMTNYVLAWARETNHISRGLYRVRNGVKRRGFIVAPHDALYLRRGSTCEYYGQLGRWESSGPGGQVWYVGPTQHAETGQDKSGSVHTAVHVPVHTAVHSDLPNSAHGSARQNQKQCTEQCIEQCTPKPDQISENKPVVAIMAEKSAGQPQQISAPIRVSQVKATERTKRTGITSPAPTSQGAKVEMQMQDGAAAPDPAIPFSPLGASPQTPLTDLTVGKYFANMGNDEQLLGCATDGELDTGKIDSTEVTLLAEAVRHVAANEMSAMPWDGQRATLVRVMEHVITLCGKWERRYPPAWLKVKHEIAQSPGKVGQPVPPAPKKWIGFQTHDGLPTARDAKTHNGAGWELCIDWIRRDDTGRLSSGYTIKNGDGIWCKAEK